MWAKGYNLTEAESAERVVRLAKVADNKLRRHGAFGFHKFPGVSKR